MATDQFIPESLARCAQEDSQHHRDEVEDRDEGDEGLDCVVEEFVVFAVRDEEVLDLQ